MLKIGLLVGLLFACVICSAGQQLDTAARPVSQKVQILRLERASYTDAARKHKVEGSVFLRVTFQANGEIGEVVYLRETSRKKKLTKRGLVTQALEAAKKIKFTPATDENGNPITVSREVEYMFTLY